MIFYWLFLVFVLGAIVGSFLNVCIYRIPLEKSVFWPGSRCGNCYQPIRIRDNIPLVSYWVLRGRCRTCGAPFSIRYFLVELLTACSFVGLFYLEVVANIHHYPSLARQKYLIQFGVIPAQGWVIFVYHALLLGFLIVIIFCDLDHREIPLPVTATGTVVGLAGATFLPWPWPSPPAEAVRDLGPFWSQPWWLIDKTPPTGLYPWPVWGPLPSWLPAGSWQLGLATGVAGVLAGTFMLRTIGFLFSTGLGKEALGLGDADLMMMAGSFLGWQPVVVAFFVSALPALVVGIIQLIFRGDNSLPFGPSLALGIVITWLSWEWIGPRVQVLFFNPTLMLALVVLCCVFMLGSAFLFRLGRLARGQ